MRNGTPDNELSEQEWDYHVGNDYYADERGFAGFRDWINYLFLADDADDNRGISDSEEDADCHESLGEDDEENGLMHNPEEGFEDSDSQKDDGPVEGSESLGAGDEGDQNVERLKSEVANLESRLRTKCGKIEYCARLRKKGRSEYGDLKSKALELESELADD